MKYFSELEKKNIRKCLIFHSKWNFLASILETLKSQAKSISYTLRILKTKNSSSGLLK